MAVFGVRSSILICSVTSDNALFCNLANRLLTKVEIRSDGMLTFSSGFIQCYLTPIRVEGVESVPEEFIIVILVDDQSTIRLQFRDGESFEYGLQALRNVRHLFGPNSCMNMLDRIRKMLAGLSENGNPRERFVPFPPIDRQRKEGPGVNEGGGVGPGFGGGQQEVKANEKDKEETREAERRSSRTLGRRQNVAGEASTSSDSGNSEVLLVNPPRCR